MEVLSNSMILEEVKNIFVIKNYDNHCISIHDV